MARRRGQLKLGGSQDGDSALNEFKEVGEAGRGQAIVTVAGLTLEGLESGTHCSHSWTRLGWGGHEHC